MIIGYTDPKGSVEANDELAEKRAAAVAEELREYGLDTVDIETIAVGERLASEDPDAWPYERRVDIVIRDA